MELTEYIRSEAYKKHKCEDNKLLQCVIYYYILFKNEFSKVDELVSRIEGKDIENRFVNIISNKLTASNNNIKSIYPMLLSLIGNIKYELINENNTDYFNSIIEIFSKYGININVKDKTIISNNLDKIIENKDVLDSKTTELANIVFKNTSVLYSEKDYEKLKIALYKYMKKNNFTEEDALMVSYLLDLHKNSTTNKIIISNNISLSQELIDSTYNKYKNDIKSFLLDTIKNNKERKSEDRQEITSFEVDEKTKLDKYADIIKIQATYREAIEQLATKLLGTKEQLVDKLDSKNTSKTK